MTLTADHRAELLGACPLFQGLGPPTSRRSPAAAIEVEFPAERVIARQGEIGTGFFIVVDGRVRVVRDGAAVAHARARASSSASCRCSTAGRASRRS